MFTLRYQNISRNALLTELAVFSRMAAQQFITRFDSKISCDMPTLLPLDDSAIRKVPTSTFAGAIPLLSKVIRPIN